MIGKISQGVLAPVKGVFGRLMDAITAIGLGIVGSAAFKFLARPEIFEKLTGVFDFIGKQNSCTAYRGKIHNPIS